MNKALSDSYLRAQLELLVEHFGAIKVQKMLADVSPAGKRVPTVSDKRRVHGDVDSVSVILMKIKNADRQLYEVLNEFYGNLKAGKVLPAPQDIFEFSQIAGIKELHGSSRRELVSSLMRFLSNQPIDLLRKNIDRASGISEARRKEGFSVLTDKLLEGI